jgi:hypothetical protein
MSEEYNCTLCREYPCVCKINEFVKVLGADHVWSMEQLGAAYVTLVNENKALQQKLEHGAKANHQAWNRIREQDMKIAHLQGQLREAIALLKYHHAHIHLDCPTQTCDIAVFLATLEEPERRE